MAVCITIGTGLLDNGKVSVTGASPSSCGGYVILNSAEYQVITQANAHLQEPDLSGSVDFDVMPADIAYVFSWGFGAVLFFWFLGYSVGIAKGLINKA